MDGQEQEQELGIQPSWQFLPFVFGEPVDYAVVMARQEAVEDTFWALGDILSRPLRRIVEAIKLPFIWAVIIIFVLLLWLHLIRDNDDAQGEWG